MHPIRPEPPSSRPVREPTHPAIFLIGLGLAGGAVLGIAKLIFG